MVKVVEAPTYSVTIWMAGDYYKAQQSLRDACDDMGLCVSLTSTRYIYSGGEEAGVRVGLINYPRFASDPKSIWMRAHDLAKRLCEALGQKSYTLEDDKRTCWISHREADQ